MGKTLSKEIILQIPILYGKLRNKTKVAEELGISISSVNKYLNLAEAAPPQQGLPQNNIENIEAKKKKRASKITPELEKQINDLYVKCMNISEVARVMGISTSTVRRHLTLENLNLTKTQNDDRDALFFYILHLFGVYSEEEPVNPWNIIQMQKFKNQGMSYKGQLLTLKYFYEVENHNTEKSHGSIGIIPFIWSRAALYYEKQANKVDQITELIQKQLQQDRLEIKINPSDYFNPKRKRKKAINLDDLKEWSDDNS